MLLGTSPQTPRIFEASAPMSNGMQHENAPDNDRCQGPDAPLAHRRPGYPSSGCVPAEPESVSPDTFSVPVVCGPRNDPRPSSGWLDETAFRAVMKGCLNHLRTHTERRHDSRSTVYHPVAVGC